MLHVHEYGNANLRYMCVLDSYGTTHFRLLFWKVISGIILCEFLL